MRAPLRIDRLLLVAALAVAFGAVAQQMPPAKFETEMRDPWVPPEARAKAATQPRTAPAAGAALDAQVEAKLRKRFEAAAGAGGTLTREQARVAGLGAIAERFDSIDRAGRGAIRFEDYLSYLRAQRAR
jgi:hypothetical protein